MTFRHRDFGRGGLIETVEVESGKAETVESKKKGVRRMKVQSDTRTAHTADCFWFPCVFVQPRDNSLPSLAPMQSKRLRELAGEEGNQAPSPQRDGCRTFLDKRAGERRGAANASC
jgi:hypothetical protein